MGYLIIIIGLMIVGVAIYLLATMFNRDSGNSFQRKQDISNKYSTNMGRFAAGKEAKASSARAGLMAALNLEAIEIDQEEERQMAAFMTGQRNIVEIAQMKKERKAHQLEERLLDIAFARNIDIEVLKKEQLNNVDIQRMQDESMAVLKKAFVYQLQDFQKLIMIREQLDSAYDREYEILVSNDPESVKEKKIAQIKADIQMMEGDADGRRRKLLQAHNGEDLGGSDQDS